MSLWCVQACALLLTQDFVLGTGRVISGWDEGLKNMCIGEKRKLQIPPHMAYGSERRWRCDSAGRDARV